MRSTRLVLLLVFVLLVWVQLRQPRGRGASRGHTHRPRLVRWALPRALHIDSGVLFAISLERHRFLMAGTVLARDKHSFHNIALLGVQCDALLLCMCSCAKACLAQCGSHATPVPAHACTTTCSSQSCD